MTDGATQDVQAHASSSTADTIATSCVPIILVPGVMGSRLAIISGRTWDPDDAASMGVWVSALSPGKQKTRRALRPVSTPATTLTDFPTGWATEKANKSLALAVADADIQGNARCMAIARAVTGATDVDTVVRYYSEVRNWASVAWGFYGPILTFLETALNPRGDEPSFPVYAFGYDWRQSNTDSGVALSQFITSTLARHPQATEAILVTHSMGGLVVRGGFEASGFMAQSVRGVVHTAQPSNGSVVCYRRFFTGVQDPFDATHTKSEKLLARIIGTDAQAYAYNMSGLTGPLQLLPNQAYSQSLGVPWLTGDGVSQDLSAIFDLYRQPGMPGILGIAELAEESCATNDEKASHSITADLRANLGAAEGFHKSVLGTAHARTYVIFSTGLSTDHAISFEALGGSIENADARPDSRYRRTGDDVIDDWAHFTVHRRSDGDATVDAVSGRCPNLSVLAPTPEATSKPLEHSALFGDADVRAQVLHYVQRLLTPGAP